MQNVCVLMPMKMSLNGSVAIEIFYAQFLFSNFKCIIDDENDEK